jgi:glycine cleavage system aminomethyltransferase T
MTVHDDRALLALQGPEAAAVRAPLVPGADLGQVYFSNFRKLDIGGHASFLTRTG